MNCIGTAFAILTLFFCLAQPHLAQGTALESKHLLQLPASIDVVYEGEAFAASCRNECADPCKSPDTNVTCADCVSGCLKKRFRGADEKQDKGSSTPGSALITVEDKDKECTADSDCVYMAAECRSCCGDPVVAFNKAFADKYGTMQKEACRGYEYNTGPCMCQPPEVACRKGRCVISQGWGGDKIED